MYSHHMVITSLKTFDPKDILTTTIEETSHSPVMWLWVINENYYDVGVIDVTTERFDYKRGHAHASAELKILAGQAFTLLTSGDFSGWDVTFETQGGHSITINN